MTPWIEIENFQCLKSSNAQGPEPCTLTTTTCLEVSQLYCPKSPKTLHDLFGDIYLVTSSVIACGHFVVYGASGPLQNCSLVLYLCVTLTWAQQHEIILSSPWTKGPFLFSFPISISITIPIPIYITISSHPNSQSDHKSQSLSLDNKNVIELTPNRLFKIRKSCHINC